MFVPKDGWKSGHEYSHSQISTHCLHGTIQEFMNVARAHPSMCATEYFPPFLTVQAEDYDTCIVGPQREEQMRSIRGFRGEGRTLRGEGPASSNLGQTQLCNPVADSQRQLGNRHHVTGKDESGDSHVTEGSEEEGRVVTLGLSL